MKTKIYIKRISNDQLITDDGKQTIETYLLVDGKTSAPDYTVSVTDLDSELVGWKYECSDYDEITGSLVITFTDTSEPEDYLEK